MKRLEESTDPLAALLLLVAVSAAVAIVSTESWRAAVLACGATAGVTITGIRFSARVATCLLAAVAVAAVVGG